MLHLAQQVIDLYRDCEIEIVPVESCTGGGLAYHLTNVPGASDVIKRGYVTYSNQAKIDLGVNPLLIEKHTVYSHEVARAMADAGRRQTQSENVLGIGITGSLFRPDPRNKGSVVGDVYVGFSHNGNLTSKRIHLLDTTDREKAKEKIVIATLETMLGTATRCLAW